MTNASGDITRTCIRCGKIVRPTLHKHQTLASSESVAGDANSEPTGDASRTTE